MPSAKQIRYYRGVLLPEIAEFMQIRKRHRKEAEDKLHKLFKWYAGFRSITKLNSTEMERYLGMVRMLCSRELGLMAREPNEPEGIEYWPMIKFLNYKLYGRQDSTID